LSSLLKPNTLSTKGEKFLHQSLHNKSMSGKIKQQKSEYRKHYSRFPKKPRVEEPQEKYSLPPPSLDAWKRKQEYSSLGGLLVI
jgi:hypothetical protein